MKFSFWQPLAVKTTAGDHEREGKAGTIHEKNPAHPDEVVITFDTDKSLVLVAVADLVAL